MFQRPSSIREALLELDAGAEAKRDADWKAQDRWLPGTGTKAFWKAEAEEAWLHLAGANEELRALQEEIQALEAERADARDLIAHLSLLLDKASAREAGLLEFLCRCGLSAVSRVFGGVQS
jgi:hypothetical protein